MNARGLSVSGQPRSGLIAAGGRPRAIRMLGITAAWGACFVAISWALTDVSPLWFAAFRAALSGTALLAVAALSGRQWKVGRHSLALLGVLALFNVAIAFGAMFSAAADVATGVASILANTQPLLIVFPAWWLYGERPTSRDGLGLALAFSGLTLIVGAGYGKGILLTVVAAVAITTGTLLTRRLDVEDLLAPIGWHFVLGSGLLALTAGLIEGPPDINVTVPFVVSLGFLSVVGTAWAFTAWFEESRRASLVSVTAWTFLVPVFGLGFGVLAGESMNAWQWLGVVATFAGLATVLVRPREGRFSDERVSSR